MVFATAARHDQALARRQSAIDGRIRIHGGPSAVDVALALVEHVRGCYPIPVQAVACAASDVA